MKKHTPAPWFIDRFYKTAINNAPGDEKHKHIAMINFFNAKDPAERIDEEEHEANVRLIAAAPELLEALELFVNWKRTGAPAIDHVMDNAKMAIAKAKGE